MPSIQRVHLIFVCRLYLIAHDQMKISSDDKKAISLILIYLGLLSFLIGIAAHFKSSFHSRAEISTTGFVASGGLRRIGPPSVSVFVSKKTELTSITCESVVVFNSGSGIERLGCYERG